MTVFNKLICKYFLRIIAACPGGRHGVGLHWIKWHGRCFRNALMFRKGQAIARANALLLNPKIDEEKGMAWGEEEDTTIYRVVVNHEEQYSIWPDYKELPNGWRMVGKTGLKKECLDYIEEVWTDMRPLSLRKQMEQAA